MEDKALVLYMGVLVEMIHTLRIKAGRAAFDTVNFVTFFEEEL